MEPTPRSANSNLELILSSCPKMASKPSDLDRARLLFELAEEEKDPARKHAALDQALGLLEVYVEDDAPSGEVAKACNLRRSHTRRLLAQLVEMRGIQIDLWYRYMMLFLGPLKTEVDAVVAQDASLNAQLLAFLKLHLDTFKGIIERRQSKP
jgi:hypothetical protein